MPRIARGAVLGGIALATLGHQLYHRRRGDDLDSRVALITGGSRGLGFLLARALAREGCRLAICARDAAELDRARAALVADGAAVLAFVCDVSDQAAVEHMVGEITALYGEIDILVNNAGIIQVGPAETMTLADYEQALAVMYWGVVYPTLAILPAMRQRRAGRIVTISSIGGRVAVPHLLPYTAAKFAAAGFSEGLRAELAGSGVAVTTVVPGLIRNGSYLNARFKGRRAAELTWFSLGATLPLISMDADRVARQIVGAIRRGEADRAIGIPATLLAALHGLAPGLTADALGLVNRFVLPKSTDASTGTASGMSLADDVRLPLYKALTGFGRAAAERTHQYPGPAATVTDAPASAGPEERP